MCRVVCEVKDETFLGLGLTVGSQFLLALPWFLLLMVAPKLAVGGCSPAGGGGSTTVGCCCTAPI